MKYLHAILAAGLLIFAGCETTTGDRTSRVARIAVNYATLKALDESTDKAERAIEIVSTARKALRGERAQSVDMLVGLARAEIRWDRLDAADSMVVNLLLEEVRIELVNRLGDGPLIGEATLRVDEVLGWVEGAAKLVAGGAAG